MDYKLRLSIFIEVYKQKRINNKSIFILFHMYLYLHEHGTSGADHYVSHVRQNSDPIPI